MYPKVRPHDRNCALLKRADVSRPLVLLVGYLPFALSFPLAAWSEPAQSAEAKQTDGSSETKPAEATETQVRKPVWVKAGKEISISTSSHEIRVTNDVKLAREQVSEFQDSPEAHFVLAVALTRTSHVEEALQEVKRARKLSFAKGGPSYFDKMINEYEVVLREDPDDLEVRYHLAWAYYMKAYVLTKYSRKVFAQLPAQPPAQAAAPQTKPDLIPTPAETKWHQDWVLKSANPDSPDATKDGSLAQQSSDKASRDEDDDAPSGGRIPSMDYAWKNAAPAVIPQIKKYYQLAIARLDGVLRRDPGDLWAMLYRAHLSAEFSGDLDSAMKVWQSCQMKYPNNPAPYFFLGEGYMKKGNLRESLSNVSKAIALRTLGN